MEKMKETEVKQQKERGCNLTLEAINIEVLNKKKKNVYNMEQQLHEQQTSPRSRRTLTKPSRSSCLCSPTTHIGSFRCRFHRTPAEGMTRGYSVGSNLSELAASKSHF